jgi:NAD(P)-dependent dehydrogenase (short-subunit alcohol dehydrogenase family)
MSQTFFRSKVVAITGAGSGIGRALAQAVVARGGHVALSDVSASTLAETVALIEAEAKARDLRVTSRVVDVADSAAVDAWADGIVREHGRVHVVVNNAGVALAGTVAALSREDYEWIMGVNFWGVMHGTKAFLPRIEISGGGAVVNVSSVFGMTAQPLMSGYNASKFAVRGFTESLQQELEITGSNVRAVVVFPGGIKTNIARSARMSDSVSMVTGKGIEASQRGFEKAFSTTPETAAKTILDGVAAGRRRVLIGADARVFDIVARLAPVGYQRVIGLVMRPRSRPKPPSGRDES